MPARKLKSLLKRHETKAESEARDRRESALKPLRDLPKDAPAALKDHPEAQAAWRQIIRLYDELESEIVTRLDLHLLINYCLALEQLAQIDQVRDVTYQTWLALKEKRQALIDEGKPAEALEIALKCVEASEALIKIDARADRKRSLLVQMEQTLYLTPRARAGVAPAQKELPEPPGELEKLLDEASSEG